MLLRLAGLSLFVLWVLSWIIPPWQWSLPFFGSLFWTYGGGIFFLWILFRDRPFRWIWGIALGLWGISLQSIWNLSVPHEKGSAVFRIATFNMDAAHYKRPRIEILAESLRRWHPHILCLQEVYLGDYTPKSFAHRLGYAHYAFLDAKRQTGMMILSDFPILHIKNHLLLPYTTNGLHEVRIRLAGGQTARVLNVHFPSYRLSRDESWQWKWFSQVWEWHALFYHRLLESISSGQKDLLWVCGDFNMMPYHPLYVKLWQSLHDSYSAAVWGEGPTWRHLLRIDYIWSGLKAASYRTRWLPHQAHAYVEAAYSVPANSPIFAERGR